MNIPFVFIDFETYFDAEYSLSGPGKLPIDNYVFDPRFHIHGLALKAAHSPSTWLTGDQAIKDAFSAINWSEAVVVAHNGYFDHFILSQIFGVRAKQWLCTMCMGRGLFGPDISNNLDSLAIRLGGEGKSDRVDFTRGKRQLSAAELTRLGKYAVNDNEECARCFYEMIQTYPPAELELIDLTLRMFVEPTLGLDLPLLEEFNREEVERKQQALAQVEWVYPYVADEQISFFEVDKSQKIKDTLMSNDKFEALLKKLKVKVPHKTSKATGAKTTAFAKSDAGFKKLLKNDDERVSQLAEARLAVKSTMGETRSQSFLNVGSRPLPIQLLYFGSHSSRWSGQGGRNPQNLTKDSPLRQAIVAPQGYVLGSVDSGQIEARLTAYVASKLAKRECLLLTWFREPPEPNTDVYCKFGSMFYKRTITKADKFDRFVSKQAVLGLGFQMSAPKFQQQMKALADIDFDTAFCEEIVTFYRTTFPEIKQMWWTMLNLLDTVLQGDSRDFGFFGFDKAGIRLPTGLHIHYNDLKRQPNDKGWNQYDYHGFEQGKKKRVHLFGGKVAENLIQGLDRTIVAEQMLIINQRYRVVTNDHDGLTALIPEAEAEEGLKWMVEVMSTPPVWAADFPVAAEGHVSERYG